MEIDENTKKELRDLFLMRAEARMNAPPSVWATCIAEDMFDAFADPKKFLERGMGGT